MNDNEREALLLAIVPKQSLGACELPTGPFALDLYMGAGIQYTPQIGPSFYAAANESTTAQVHSDISTAFDQYNGRLPYEPTIAGSEDRRFEGSGLTFWSGLWFGVENVQEFFGCFREAHLTGKANRMRGQLRQSEAICHSVTGLLHFLQVYCTSARHRPYLSLNTFVFFRNSFAPFVASRQDQR